MNNIDNTDKNLDIMTLKIIIDYCKSKYHKDINNYNYTGYKYFENKCDAYNDVISYCSNQLINSCTHELDNIVNDESSN